MASLRSAFRLASSNARLVAITGLAVLSWVASPSVDANPFNVTIDTTGLTGQDAILAFDFIDGDGVVNNTVTVDDFSTDGILGGAMSTGGAAGGLPNPGVFLSDSDFVNEMLQEITLGSSLSFTLTLTEQSAGGLPDQFSLFLLDPTGLSSLFPTTDPTGADALFAVDIDGSTGGALFSYAADPPIQGVGWQVDSQTAVPSPPTIWLFGAALLGWMRTRGIWRRPGNSSQLDVTSPV